jgi:formamidopyrimidine-DNA glycosylase
MFEIPEYVTLARQMAESLSGKRIATGTLGNSPHKFVWYNRKPAEVASLVKGMRPTPIDPGFTAAHLSALIEACAVEGSRSVKGLLTQDQLIPGLGNALAQDIMFTARLHPRQPVAGLSRTQVKNLHQAIVGTVAEAIRLGGRSDETDLQGNPGSYRRIMDSAAAGHPCPACGTKIEAMAYLGGAC